MSAEATTVVCTYNVKPSKEKAFEALLEDHLPALIRLGLAKDRPTMSLTRTDDDDLSSYVQVFEWTSVEAAQRAHEVPDVISIWEPMAMLCEPRDDRPAMDFPHFEPLLFEIPPLEAPPLEGTS